MRVREDDIGVRAAKATDAAEMSSILAEILTKWGSGRASDAPYVREFYVEHPEQVSCVVAVNGAGEVLGFQSLKRAGKDNPYDVEPGWGIIGTYVRLGIGRRGIGAALFAATCKAARLARLSKIDATIGEENKTAQGYYNAMGFWTYRKRHGAVCKCYEVTSVSENG